MMAEQVQRGRFLGSYANGKRRVIRFWGVRDELGYWRTRAGLAHSRAWSRDAGEARRFTTRAGAERALAELIRERDQSQLPTITGPGAI